MANPLDAFVPTSTARRDIRIEKLPALKPLVAELGLTGGVAKFDELMETWRARLERLLMQALAAPTATVTTTVTPPTITVTPGPPAGLPALETEVDQLSTDLAAHIASKIVHGTSTPVVGQFDEQLLDAKTIGESVPRNATFNHMVQSSTVPLGESYTIKEGYNMVVAGPFTIEGELTVLGQIAIVTSS